MYYIDSHAHVYPDRIAKYALQSMMDEQKFTHMPRSFNNGTKDGLIGEMSGNKIKTSVVLPVATAPKQFDSINRFAIEINNKNGIISLGGIHPDNDNVRSRLEFIKQSGLRGIKIHPDYQGVYIDDDRYVNIIKICMELGLIVAIHSGVDVAKPDPVHCSAERAKNMIDRVFDGKPPKKCNIILAHMGANMQYDEVERYLIDSPAYFDTAFMLDKTDTDTTMKVIRRHGVDKILFGTDSPWVSQAKYTEIIESLPLSEKELSMIAHENAKELFGI